MTTPINDWLSASQICFGLILTKRQDLTKYHEEMFVPPYDDGFTSWKAKADTNRVAEIVSTNLYEAALSAAATVSDVNEIDWVKYLLRVSNAYKVGDRGEPLCKALKMGKEVSPEKIVEFSQSLRNLANPDAIGLKPLDDVNIDGFDPFIETGWAALDNNFGGISRHRPTLVGADTGLGKTTFTQRVVDCWLERWPKSRIAVYSLELSAEAWKFKASKMFPRIMTHMTEKRLLLSANAVSIADIHLELAASEVDLAIIDDLSYVVTKATPEAYVEANIQLNTICRTLKKPLMIVSQFNATGKSGGLPTRSSFAWGGPSNDKAGLTLALYRAEDEDELNGRYEYLPDYPMMIIGLKSGDGWIKQGGPGAVCLPDVKNLWANEEGIWQKAGGKTKNKKWTVR